MPQTVSAPLIGRLKSRAVAVAMCNAAVLSIDVLTITHNLGASPTMVTLQIRSIPLFPTSGGTITPAVRSWNASQVIIDNPAGVTGATVGAASQVLIDVWSEITHTIVA